MWVSLLFLRAEGPAVLPAQGNALGMQERRILVGPTGQPFAFRGEPLARWAEIASIAASTFPRALPWAG